MCQKLRYRNPRIDECLIEEIEEINKEGIYKTLASCCGHSKYPKTIVVINRQTREISEYFTNTPIPFKKRNRYYKKDKKNFYYIPEMVQPIF